MELKSYQQSFYGRYTASYQKYDIKIRTYDFYNPDYITPDGTWLEITLSENTAYKKLFRYGHQAPGVTVL